MEASADGGRVAVGSAVDLCHTKTSCRNALLRFCCHHQRGTEDQGHKDDRTGHCNLRVVKGKSVKFKGGLWVWLWLCVRFDALGVEFFWCWEKFCVHTFGHTINQKSSHQQGATLPPSPLLFGSEAFVLNPQSYKLPASCAGVVATTVAAAAAAAATVLC